jgi:hypothetical protein
VYVVEVWGESKRLAISHRRYNEFYKFRGDLLEDLGKEGLHDEVRRPQALFTARRFAGLTSGRGVVAVVGGRWGRWSGCRSLRRRMSR